MTAGGFALIAAALFAWGVFSAPLERADLTAPIVFVGVGLLSSRVLSLDADAGAASVEGGGGAGPGHALLHLLVGAVVGASIGLGGGRLHRFAWGRRWVDEEFAGPAVLALALLAYAASLACGGNGFVAAFAGGIAFGQCAGRAGPQQVFYVEQTAGLLPVALVLLGSGLGRRAGAVHGVVRARGLASVVFALLAVEELGPRADTAVAVIVTTVLLSVLAHGVTAASAGDEIPRQPHPTDARDAASTPVTRRSPAERPCHWGSVSYGSDDAAPVSRRHATRTPQMGEPR